MWWYYGSTLFSQTPQLKSSCNSVPVPVCTTNCRIKWNFVRFCTQSVFPTTPRVKNLHDLTFTFAVRAIWRRNHKPSSLLKFPLTFKLLKFVFRLKCVHSPSQRKLCCQICLRVLNLLPASAAPPLPLSGRTETAVISSLGPVPLACCKAPLTKNPFVVISRIHH